MSTSGDEFDRVLKATDLVGLIGEQIPLRRKGREWVGNCLFCQKHDPTMYISPSKQIYKCFACGNGGDAISFVKSSFKMDFRQALQYLKRRSGQE